MVLIDLCKSVKIQPSIILSVHFYIKMQHVIIAFVLVGILAAKTAGQGNTIIQRFFINVSNLW